MGQISHYWHKNGRNYHLCIRWWWHGNPLAALGKWLLGKAKWYGSRTPIEVSQRTITHSQDRCYCPDGTQSEFRLEFFTVGCWGWLSRSWVKTPCHCDKVIWCCFPENHLDEIEEYGEERLRQEYPGLMPQLEQSKR